jgi:carbamoyl-phosphate synthase small subunit
MKVRRLARRRRSSARWSSTQSLTGYQEIITDPSYRGQMVCMTLAHVGNTGVNTEDVESDQPQITAFIVREVSSVVSNWRANETLHDYGWRGNGIPGISEVDTRALTRGCATRACCTAHSAPTVRTERRRVAGAGARLGGLDGRDLVREVTCPSRITGSTARASSGRLCLPDAAQPRPRAPRPAYSRWLWPMILASSRTSCAG